MQKEKTALFIGHDEPYGIEYEAKVTEAIVSLIDRGVETFLCGGMGQFDWLCARVAHKLKKQYPQIQVLLVIPYLTFNILDREYFDDVVYPDLEKYYFKQAIIERNKYMIANSGFAICHVTHSWGGAAATYKKAKRQKLEILDL